MLKNNRRILDICPRPERANIYILRKLRISTIIVNRITENNKIKFNNKKKKNP